MGWCGRSNFTPFPSVSRFSCPCMSPTFAKLGDPQLLWERHPRPPLCSVPWFRRHCRKHGTIEQISMECYRQGDFYREKINPSNLTPSLEIKGSCSQ